MMPARRRSGFTLVELMVAVAVASVLVIIVYSVYIRGAKTYRVQNMALGMQAQARYALDHLKRDIGDAGFNGATNSRVDANLCGAPAFELRAITLQRLGDVANPTENANIQPLAVTLFGDYTGYGQVFRTKSIVGSVITLPSDVKSIVTEQQFKEMFAGGRTRYLRILDQEQYEMLVEIVSADYAAVDPTIRLASAPQTRGAGSSCGIQGFGSGLEVNPAMFIRYRVVKDGRDGEPADKTVLVREELLVDGVTPVTGTRLIVAEYVVDLNVYDLAFDDDDTGVQPSISYQPVAFPTVINDSGEGLLGNKADARPEDLRMLTLKVTVRTAEEDEQLFHVPRATPTSPIQSYESIPGLQGAARTMTLATKVMFNTLAIRNAKPAL